MVIIFIDILTFNLIGGGACDLHYLGKEVKLQHHQIRQLLIAERCGKNSGSSRVHRWQLHEVGRLQQQGRFG